MLLLVALGRLAVMPIRPEANFGFLWWSAGEASNCFAGPVRFDDSPQPAPRRHVDGAGSAGQAGGARDTTPLSRSGGRRRRPVNTASRAPQGSSRRWARSQLVQSAARPARQGSRSTERLELQGRQMEGRPSAAAMARQATPSRPPRRRPSPWEGCCVEQGSAEVHVAVSRLSNLLVLWSHERDRRDGQQFAAQPPCMSELVGLGVKPRHGWWDGYIQTPSGGTYLGSQAANQSLCMHALSA